MFLNMDIGKKNSGLQRPRVDRFVAPRESLYELQRQYNFAGKPIPEPYWYHQPKQAKYYASRIDAAFGTGPRKARFESEQTWPCVPRRSTFLSSNCVRHLPMYSSAADLIDWSNNDIVVAALGKTYYKLSWYSQSPAGEGLTRYNTTCCRFDPTGERIAFGTETHQTEIHNSLSKWVASCWCRCATQAQLCLITAVDWSPTGNSLVTGCSRGMLTAFDRDAKFISYRQAAFQAILHLKVSPDARYVAAATYNSTQVLVLLWPSLVKSHKIGTESMVKTIAWHPWRSALLGIGMINESGSWVSLCNAHGPNLRATIPVSNGDFSLDAMLFSHRTGELLLSLWNTEQIEYPKANAHLVVMSGPNTVVDQWRQGNYGRVRTMVFSPDGTKLATATAKEPFIFWNFLPPDNKPNKNTKRSRFSAIPAYIDLSMNGFTVR